MRTTREVTWLTCVLALAGACSEGRPQQAADQPGAPAQVAGDGDPSPSPNRGATSNLPATSNPTSASDVDASSPMREPTGTLDAGPPRQGPPINPPVTPPVTQNLVRVVPTDTRAPQTAAIPPVPISGGTLIVTPDHAYAVASDPDRDRVSVIDVANATLLHTITLEKGDEPGRLAADDLGRVHVALRRGGSVVSIDLLTGLVLDRRAVCPAPRGIAFDASTGALRVACASGELVTLPAIGGAASESVHLDADLRDVVVTSKGLLVSRFKRAELLSVDANATSVVQKRVQPQPIQKFFSESSGALIADSLAPEIAWRTVGDGNGGVVMLHQGARSGEIALVDPDAAGSANTTSASSGPYGGGGQCDAVVQTELTLIDSAGNVLPPRMIDATLAVDIAVAPTTSMVAVVQAGMHDPGQPLPMLQGEDGAVTPGGEFIGGTTALSVFPLQQDPTGGDPQCAFPNVNIDLPGQTTAVAYADDTKLLVQTREPASIVVIDSSSATITNQIDLGGDSVYDSGHELFHRDAGARIACASCHAEGGDDGHVWMFAGVGARRTQSVNVGLEGTAPFHWSGDQPDVATLMEDVFVTRMGGVHESDDRTAALQSWLFALTPLPRQRAVDDPAALRGQALFEGDAMCASCHNGPKLTNNMNIDVGTGETLQVPSLRGIGYRAPLIHTGCAATLRDRFDPKCGGDQHGRTSQLGDAQIDDLIAYLQTL